MHPSKEREFASPGEGGKCEFESALVVSFAGCPVGDCIGSEFPGHLDLRLGDKRAGDRGAEKVLGFVNGIPRTIG